MHKYGYGYMFICRYARTKACMSCVPTIYQFRLGYIRVCMHESCLVCMYMYMDMCAPTQFSLMRTCTQPHWAIYTISIHTIAHTYMHACIHTYIHVHMHTLHAYTHTQRIASRPAAEHLSFADIAAIDVFTLTRTMHLLAHAKINIYIRIHPYVHMCIHTCVEIWTCIHKHIHISIHTRTYIHICIYRTASHGREPVLQLWDGLKLQLRIHIYRHSIYIYIYICKHTNIQTRRTGSQPSQNAQSQWLQLWKGGVSGRA
jgi:hypothetical protein